MNIHKREVLWKNRIFLSCREGGDGLLRRKTLVKILKADYILYLRCIILILKGDYILQRINNLVSILNY